jgi:C1A family cysteine protease
MAEKQGVPLVGIDGFPEAAANRLAGLWLTTAEELVSAAGQAQGVQGLAEYLELPEDEVTDLVELAVAALPPDVSFAPDDVLEVGLGALDEAESEDPDAEPVSFAPLPGQVDQRSHMPPVRNQRRRGTCVAHACVAVREFLLGEQSTGGDFSEQFLYWRCKEVDGRPSSSGTWIRVGMERLQEDGVCVEEVWPYNPDPIPGKEGQGPPPPGAKEAAQRYTIGDAPKLQARWVTSLRETLAGGKLIAFGVPVYTYWLREPVRSSGDIRMPLSSDHKEGGHAMCMVGYEDDPDVPGGGFFIVRNSWGTTWGSNSALEPGYCRIPYDYMTQYGLSAYTASAPDAPPEDPKSLWEQIAEQIRRLFG